MHCRDCATLCFDCVTITLKTKIHLYTAEI
ncbi:four-helix bundle copper-binding protein [Flammeovirga pectinis]|uniref:Four-helix bundle copper-binding protein n=1 Tax=Flammeovirga pectinis TaxID=2494373 RepID=A0A3Q9FRL2_9BACT|nr:four-helix bundle copper-binding protein [Flammeovirga pectinis]